MKVPEAMQVEEVAYGPGHCIADARSRCDDVGARPQVRHAPQVLQSTSWRVQSKQHGCVKLLKAEQGTSVWAAQQLRSWSVRAAAGARRDSV